MQSRAAFGPVRCVLLPRSSAGHATNAAPNADTLSHQGGWGPLGTYGPTIPGPVDPYRDASDNIQVFNTALMDPGASKSFVFDRPGLWTFTCHPHPWMKGHIIVSADKP